MMVSLVLPRSVTKGGAGLHASHDKLCRSVPVAAACYIQPRSARDSAWLPVTTK